LKYVTLGIVFAIWIAGIVTGIPMTNSYYLSTQILGYLVFIGCIAGGIGVIFLADYLFEKKR
jgi:hypothetical protein